MSHIDLSDAPIDQLEAEILAVPFFQDQRPQMGPAALVDWRLNDGLTQLLLREEVQGAWGERLLLQSNGKIPVEWLLFYGAGDFTALTATSYRQMVQEMVRSCLEAGYQTLAIGLPPLAEATMASVVDAVECSMKEAEVSSLTCQVGFYPTKAMQTS